MLNISISEDFKRLCPDFRGAAILSKVVNTQHNDRLWMQIDKYIDEYKQTHKIDDIKKNPVIAATRQAYKRLGKDPNRYRPSAEALCRRIVRGLPLYQIDTLVDLINLVSIRTGYSIGGFDADKITGNTLVLGIGMADEPFEAIGRGILNIEGLPVYRDELGGIGTPTSDHERTKITLNTSNFLALINGYNGEEGLAETVRYMEALLNEYTGLGEIEVWYY